MSNKIKLSEEQIKELLENTEVPIYMHSPYLSKSDYRVYFEIDVEKLHFFQFGKLGHNPITFKNTNDK